MTTVRRSTHPGRPRPRELTAVRENEPNNGRVCAQGSWSWEPTDLRASEDDILRHTVTVDHGGGAIGRLPARTAAGSAGQRLVQIS